MEQEIMGKIKDKPALIQQYENKLAELREALKKQAGLVSPEKMAYPTSDMISFSNEDNLNYQEYRNIKLEIENLEKEMSKVNKTL